MIAPLVMFEAAAIVGILLTRKEPYLEITNAILAYTSMITLLVVTIPCGCRFLPYEKLVGRDYLRVVRKRSVVVVLVTGVIHAFLTMWIQLETPATLLWVDIERALVPKHSDFAHKADLGIWLVYIVLFGSLTAAIARMMGSARAGRFILALLWVVVPMALLHSMPNKHVWDGKYVATSVIIVALAVFSAVVVVHRVLLAKLVVQPERTVQT